MKLVEYKQKPGLLGVYTDTSQPFVVERENRVMTDRTPPQPLTCLEALSLSRLYCADADPANEADLRGSDDEWLRLPVCCRRERCRIRDAFAAMREQMLPRGEPIARKRIGPM